LFVGWCFFFFLSIRRFLHLVRSGTLRAFPFAPGYMGRNTNFFFSEVSTAGTDQLPPGSLQAPVLEARAIFRISIVPPASWYGGFTPALFSAFLLGLRSFLGHLTISSSMIGLVRLSWALHPPILPPPLPWMYWTRRAQWVCLHFFFPVLFLFFFSGLYSALFPTLWPPKATGAFFVEPDCAVSSPFPPSPSCGVSPLSHHPPALLPQPIPLNRAFKPRALCRTAGVLSIPHLPADAPPHPLPSSLPQLSPFFFPPCFPHGLRHLFFSPCQESLIEKSLWHTTPLPVSETPTHDSSFLSVGFFPFFIGRTLHNSIEPSFFSFCILL